MNIYINNEEVICSQKLTIKESLSNTSSVILNNVYPKSWENDKDYVSRFYMPKDYSHCVITDPNITNEVTQEIITYIPGRDGQVDNNYETILADCRIIYKNGINIVEQLIGNYVVSIKITEYIEGIKNNDTVSFSVYYSNTQVEEGAVLRYGGILRAGETFENIDKTYTYAILDRPSKTPETTELYVEQEEQTIVETNTYTNHILFNGFVKNSGNINLDPRYPHYSTLQLLDYKALLSEGATLDYVLESQKVSEAINKVVEGLKGFEVGILRLENDETIKPYSCDQKTPYDVLEYLAEISGSRWITETKDEQTTFISFYSIDSMPRADNILYTEDYFKNNNIKDIKYSYSAKDYRNKQTIVSNNVLSTLLQVERVIADGTTSLTTNSPVGEIATIESGGIEFTYVTNAEHEQGYEADFYYSYNSKDITARTAQTYGKVFTISYYPVVTSREVVYNQSEIDRISESTNRNGTIARYEKRTDTNNNKELNQIAQSYIEYKGNADITLTIQTHNKDILKIGQQVFFNAPLEDLKTNYLVTEKQTDMITTGNQQVLFYTYKLSSSFNDENAINFFDNQRRKLSSNIGEGEYITRYIDIPSATNIIFYGLTITGGNSNILDAPLNFVL